MKKISGAQISKIWATARELGLDEDLLRAKVKAVTGSESISSLTMAQAKKVIDSMVGNKPTRAANMATKKQLWLINKLAAELGWADNPKRLAGFIRKYAKVDNIQWLTRAQAWRIIEGLKKLIERAASQAAGK